MQFIKGTGPANGYNMPKGYTAGSDDWVTRFLMAYDPAAYTDSNNGQVLWIAMTFCFGGSGTNNQGGLALLDASVNGKKGTFFSLNNPYSSAAAGAQSDAHKTFLNTGGVFTYLANPKIWLGFTATSKCIENVLWNFDQQHKWGTDPSELKRPADGTWQNGVSFKYGLRSLYCGWIDAELAKTESIAGTWAADAKSAYSNAFPPATDPIAKSFLDNIMGGQGKLTVASMKLPRSGGGPSASKYGVWGSPSLPPPK